MKKKVNVKESFKSNKAIMDITITDKEHYKVSITLWSLVDDKGPAPESDLYWEEANKHIPNLYITGIPILTSILKLPHTSSVNLMIEDLVADTDAGENDIIVDEYILGPLFSVVMDIICKAIKVTPEQLLGVYAGFWKSTAFQLSALTDYGV